MVWCRVWNEERDCTNCEDCIFEKECDKDLAYCPE